MKLRILTSILAITAVWASTGGVAKASSAQWVPPSTCTGINCASTNIFANIISSANLTPNGMEPFVVQLMSTPSHCTRFDVVSQNTDTEIVVTSPDGTVWRNDDRAPGDLRPLVVIPAGASVPGWYTVQISRYNGVSTAPGNHFDAQLVYGRYNGPGNPNCANPTPPTLTTNTMSK